MSAWGSRLLGSSLSSSGSRNASVLPEPVHAWTMTSRPVEIGANAARWRALGCVTASSARLAVTRSTVTPRPSKPAASAGPMGSSSDRTSRRSTLRPEAGSAVEQASGRRVRQAVRWMAVPAHGRVIIARTAAAEGNARSSTRTVVIRSSSSVLCVVDV